MKTPFYIAQRYLIAKKSHNLINIITWISILGVSVGAFALIVVLSVFNGFEDLVSSMVNKLAPDLQITAVKGKTMSLDSVPMSKLLQINGIEKVLPTITEDALFRFGEKQHIGKVKGVPTDYQEIAKMNDGLMVGGEAMQIADAYSDYAVLGYGVAWYLGINAGNTQSAMVQIYVPSVKGSSFSFQNSFNSGSLNVSGVFLTQQDVDGRLVIVPLQWLSELAGYGNAVSAVEIFVKPQADLKSIKKQVKTILGDSHQVLNQFEQQATLFKMMRSEKWVIFLILTFILVMATFNIIGSLSMLIIDKSKDVTLLKTMGADSTFIKKVFMSEGMLISVAGGIIGLILGVILVLVQQQFGLVKFGTGGNYVVDAYPVALHLKDILLVFVTIIVIGASSAFLTVRQSLRKIKDTSLTAR